MNNKMNVQKKTTLVLGASPKPERYSNAAVKLLLEYGHPVIALARRQGNIGSVPIVTEPPLNEEIDTVTLYVGPQHQPQYYEYLLKLKPRRVIFNPGTFNLQLEKMLKKAGIEPVEHCTLVMLRSNEY